MSKLREKLSESCPLLWGTVAYLAVLGTGRAATWVIYRANDRMSVRFYLLVGAVATVAFVLEILVARGWACSWIPERVYGRWMVYCLLIIPGVFILSATTSGVGIYYRASVVLLFVIPMLTSLVVHSQREHTRVLNDESVKILRVLSEWPFLVFIALVVVSIVILVFGERIVDQ